MQMRLSQPAVSPPITFAHTAVCRWICPYTPAGVSGLPALARLARLASLAKPIGLVSRTEASSTAFEPCNTQAEYEARAREASKGIHWALCEATSPGQGCRCLVSFHSCTCPTWVGMAYRERIAGKLPHSIPTGEWFMQLFSDIVIDSRR